MKRGVFIETNNVARFLAAVAMAEDTEKGRPGMLMAHGVAGLGKTVAALNAYAENGGVYIRAWQDWTQNAFLQTICFEVTGARPRLTNKCKVEIIEALGKEPRTIYIDEADRLSMGRKEDLRDLHDETGCPICMIGEPGLAAQVAARSRINDRIPPEFRIRFEPITPRDIGIYALRAADLQLSAEACKVVHRLCKGNFRRAHNQVVSLEQMAKSAQVNKVDEAMAKRLGGGK